MPLESATYIHQLEPANPPSTDQIAQADDHLRLIKQTLKNTFPNINAPITASDEQLNGMFVMPIGAILAWYGDAASVPSGWAICNGSTVSRTDGAGTIATPDLRNKVIIGAGATVAQGETGGAATATGNTGAAGAHTHTVSGGAHTHTGAVGDHALTEAEMPQHRHGNGVADDNVGNIFPYGTKDGPSGGNVNNDAGSNSKQGLTEIVGGGQAHSHPLTINSSTHTHTVSNDGSHTHSVTVSTLQPSYGLHFIMKV